jgi:hypothetical protein
MTARYSVFVLRWGVVTGLSTLEANGTAAEPLFDAFDAWIKAQPASMQVRGKFSSSITKKPSGGWAKAGAPEGQVSLPWDDPHHDTEIGTEVSKESALLSHSLMIPFSHLICQGTPRTISKES